MSDIKFDIQPYIDMMNILVEGDETERALKVLDLLPAFYRQNIPKPLYELKNEILKQVYTSYDYMVNTEDGLKPDYQADQFIDMVTRANIVYQDVKSANQSLLKPHIADFGPGDFLLPIGMKVKNASFTYQPIGIQPDSNLAAKERLGDSWSTTVDPQQPIYYVAFEIIEHLHFVDEIRTHANRLPRMPDKIFLSTPTFTYATGNPTWRTRKCPHLRAYTPKEFYNETIRLFPEYKLTYHEDVIQTISGVLNI